MSENSNFIVELFIRTLQMKHKLTFEKDKAEYFRVLFDTYLNGQGNPEELKDYIAAGIDDPAIIDTLATQVIEWQGKATEMKAAEEAKKKQEQEESEKMKEYVETKTKEVKEEVEKKESHGRKKHKRDPNDAKKEGEGEQKKETKGLKGQLTAKGKEKCKFYPFCKNPETCQFFHPTEKCSYFPNCRFGQSCLYEHEACKYKEKCLKPNCPYAHPFKKTNPIEEMMKTFMNQNNPLNRGKKRFHKPKEPQNQDNNHNEEQAKKE